MKHGLIISCKLVNNEQQRVLQCTLRRCCIPNRFTLPDEHANAAWTMHATQVRPLPLLFSYSSHQPPMHEKATRCVQVPPPTANGEPHQGPRHLRGRGA